MPIDPKIKEVLVKLNEAQLASLSAFVFMLNTTELPENVRAEINKALECLGDANRILREDE